MNNTRARTPAGVNAYTLTSRGSESCRIHYTSDIRAPEHKDVSESDVRDERLMNLGPKLPDEGSPCEEQSQETDQGALFHFGLFETRALNSNLLMLACSHSSAFPG